MAARETGIGHVEDYMHAGKLLSLDLLVKVLEDRSHNWSHVRTEVHQNCAANNLFHDSHFVAPEGYRNALLHMLLSQCSMSVWLHSDSQSSLLTQFQ